MVTVDDVVSDKASIAQLSDVRSHRIAGSRRATTVSVPKSPMFNTVTTWVIMIGRNCWILSQFSDRGEITWIDEVWTRSLEELADSGEERYSHFDRFLVDKIEKILPKDLNLEYRSKMIEAAANKTVILGRQLIKMVIEYYKCHSALGVVYSYENLYELEWFGDYKIGEFIMEWERIIENLAFPLEDTALRDLLLPKIEKSHLPAFVADLQNFKREKSKSLHTGVDTEGYSLLYLMNMMRRHLSEVKETKLLEQRKQSVKAPGNRSQRQPKNAAPAIADADAAPAEGKGGSKTRSNRRTPDAKGKAKAKAKGGAPPAKGAAPQDGEKNPKLCWNHQNHLHNKGVKACEKGVGCRFTHGKKIPETEFKAMSRPGSRTRSNTPGAKKKDGKGGGKGDRPEGYTDKNGEKQIRCCWSFLLDKNMKPSTQARSATSFTTPRLCTTLNTKHSLADLQH